MSDAVDSPVEPLQRLLTGVEERLSGTGWRRRRLGGRPLAVFTRPIDDEFAAAVRIDLGDEPRVTGNVEHADLAVQFGVGFEPLTGLMPILTLAAEPVQIAEPDESGLLHRRVNVGDTTAIDRAVDELSAAIARHPLDFADAHASLPALQCALQDLDQTPPNEQYRLLPALLAATGQPARAAALAAEHRDSPATAGDRNYRRFARQLTRWIDAGGPSIPSAEDTVARLPAHAFRSGRPSLADVRQTSALKRAAVAAARYQSAGKMAAELQTMLMDEYALRGLTLPASAAATVAAIIARHRSSPGRLATAGRAASLIARTVADTLSQIRAPQPTLAWLQPPERAAYRLPRTRAGWTSVTLTDDAGAWLTAAVASSSQRFGPVVTVDLWLTRPAANGPYQVHLGQHQVGLLLPTTEPALARYSAAAEFYDEDLLTTGRIFPAPVGPPHQLEIALPEE